MNAIGIYGNRLPEMERVLETLCTRIGESRARMKAQTGMDPVEHVLARIKSEESMREKCRRKGLPETAQSALEVIHDALGIRVVCAFLDDVYALRNDLARMSDVEIINEKDYIRRAKPNGYRSYHMILRFQGYFAEIQLRTISMDTWAALEHHMKYKKSLGGSAALIEQELKRCADELASTDVTMQTIRNMIFEEGGEAQ
ncbi:MAG: GTP pyrophosphokinase family protein [Clostridia bacterium]|nr:GTP pyrophosphokinase family protein [Clostridia bacterium]MBQ8971839.1 GTP pyrophosphokinase family protein [Clostridia bacterium]